VIKIIFKILIFAIAFGFVEAAVVVYGGMERGRLRKTGF